VYKDKNLEGGFKYNSGFDYYFHSVEEKKHMKMMDADARKVFLTDGLQALLDGETSSRHLIELETIPDLNNICLVKLLANCHVGQHVISFKYKQGFREIKKITMHPHLLKEYNCRWFLFGYVIEDGDSKKIVNFSLDRIVYNSPEDIMPRIDILFKNASRDMYKNYFKDIVGVTKEEGKEIETITFRTTNFFVHNLLLSKKLHSSQEQSMEFDEKKGEGEFTLRVIPNIELRTKLLSFGDGVYLMGDGQFQREFRDVVAKMHMNSFNK
jgi:hypothetical protein